jgi:ubiquinone/menaquinone biosynthesis C-methylase UbiE
MILTRQYRDIRRTRKVYKILQLPQEGKIIDISCGGGRLLKKIENNHPRLELYGVDVTPGFLALHPELSKIKFTTATADQIPFSNNNFDITICSLSLHHYKNIQAVLTEIKRITKQGGQIYLIDIFPKNKWSQSLYNFVRCHEQYHFEKFYTLIELRSLLNRIDLKITQTVLILNMPRVVATKIVY